MKIYLKLLVSFILILAIHSCGKDPVEPTIKSDAKDITKFEYNSQIAVIDRVAKSISMEVAYGSDLTDITPYISISAKATVSPATNTSQNFTNPVEYTVTAEDGSSKNYLATLTQRACIYDNVHPFKYGGKNYEIIKEGASWLEALSCAKARGGYLAEINSSSEDESIYGAIIDANITLNNTIASDGGGASYVWIGASDIDTEGKWLWEHSANQFWEGNYSGTTVEGRYSNWGDEPDNFGNQDCLGLALTGWPLGSGNLGKKSQWNDVKCRNLLFYVIEYD